MHHRDDFWGPETRLFSLERYRRRPGIARAVTAVLALAVIGGAGWYWFRGRTPAQPLPAAGAPPAMAARPAPPATDLPSLDASDEFVRDVVGQLSSHPQLARWLVTDDLVRHFVAAVVTIAHGGSPAPQVEFLRPGGTFDVVGTGGRTVADPASYRRYALVTEAFISLDTEGTARLYHDLEPLFDRAYHELGFTDSSFTDALTRAMRSLVAVEIPSRPPALVPSDSAATTWAFADPALEARSPAVKHLLRLGPENARRVQEKLAELLPLIMRQ